MAKSTRTNLRNIAVGVALLALSGSLLAVDVVTTHAGDSGQRLPALAEALPVVAPRMAATPRAVAAPHRLLERTVVVPIVRNVVHRSDAVRARPREPQRIAASIHETRTFRVPPAPRALARITTERKIIAPKRVAIEAVAAVRRVPVVARADTRVAAKPAPRATGRPPSPAANRRSAPRRTYRSAVEAAQYFAVRTVEAQTHGLEHVAAVTHKRGTNRLVVYIIARTHAGTLVEYEVLRRNGIGFAVESRTTRFVAVAAHAKAAAGTSLARNDRGR